MSQFRRTTIKVGFLLHPSTEMFLCTFAAGGTPVSRGECPAPLTKGLVVLTVIAEKGTWKPSLSGHALAGRLEAVGPTQGCFQAGCGRKVAQGEVSQSSRKNSLPGKRKVCLTDRDPGEQSAGTCTAVTKMAESQKVQEKYLPPLGLPISVKENPIACQADKSKILVSFLTPLLLISHLQSSVNPPGSPFQVYPEPCTQCVATVLAQAGTTSHLQQASASHFAHTWSCDSQQCG